MTLPNDLLILRSEHISATVLNATGARMWGRLSQLVAVIVGQLLPCPDIPTGDNPDGAARLLHVTVRVTGMVDVAGLVPVCLCVNVIALIERKDIDIPFCQAFVAFCFGDLLACVLDDASALFDGLGGKESPASNRRCPNP